jgi:putative ABC transport system ATP-binding protein
MGIELRVEDMEWAFAAGCAPFLVVPRLELPAGAFAALSGPSGCGKTSLLFLLAGLERPGQGRVLWGGEDLARMSEGRRDRFRRRHLGMVFQDFLLVPTMSVWENVVLPSRFDRLSPARAGTARASEMLERVGIRDRRRAVATLSRGEMQRVAVARALLARPQVLLADEPTASLDQASGEAVAGLLTQLARAEGISLVVATHDRGLVARAPRRLQMDHGQITSDMSGQALQ